MAATYAAMQDWLAAHGRRGAGPSWEVYGDPADDPAQTRTDVYVLLAPAEPGGDRLQDQQPARDRPQDQQ